MIIFSNRKVYIRSTVIILFSLLTFFQLAHGGEGTFHFTDPKLSQVIQKVYQLEEIHAQIDEAQQQGPIDVLFVEMAEMNSKALWDSMNRRIVINAKFGLDSARIIHSILFELQNAISTPKLNALTRQAASGEIQKNDFIDGIEWIEHQNALRTKHLLEKGIAQGIFPLSSRWPVPESFSDHLSMQRASGHTDFIARKYEILKNNPNIPLPS